MLIIYNILQLSLLLLLLLPVLIYITARRKYRGHVLKRLGFGLDTRLSSLAGKSQTRRKSVWVHALSVGEVTSALPLLAALRESFPDVNIVFSSSTRSGLALAEKKATKFCDAIIPSPLDIFCVVNHFLRRISPDLLILVETDFWPNTLCLPRLQKIPILLVNGRISDKSFRLYKKYAFLFQKMFTQLSHLCVQNESDKKRLCSLGVSEEKISKLGNLKFASCASNAATDTGIFRFPGRHLCIAGSTHRGEEKILFEALTSLHSNPGHGRLSLVIAPRDIGRTREIEHLAAFFSLSAQRHSENRPFREDIYILDTLGDLVSFYRHADFCFVGGSLIEKGGHNPIEPAVFGKPVLIGPYMNDFDEIADGLLECGGARCVHNADELSAAFITLSENKELRTKQGRAARTFVQNQQGLLNQHIELIRKYL